MGRGPIVFEDFDSYTEVDDAGVIQVNKASIGFTNLNRTERGFVYKDFGVGFFTDYTEYFEFQVSGAQNLSQAMPWTKSNNAQDVFQLYSTDRSFVHVLAYDDSYVLYLRQHEPYVGYTDDTVSISASTTYFCQIVCDGAGGYTMYVRTVSHSGDIIAGGTLTVSAETESYRYHFGLNNWDSNNAGRTVDGFSQNHDLQLQSAVPIMVHHRQQQGES